MGVRLFVAFGAALVGLILSGSGASALGYETSIGIIGLAHAGGVMYVGWTGTDNHLNIGQTFGDSDIQNKNTFTDLAHSGTGPGMAAFGTQVYAAWEGTDGHVHIGHYVGTPTLDCDTRLSETTLSSPSLVSNTNELLIAWTGTDSANHLNIAVIDMSTCSSTHTMRIASGTKTTVTDTSVAGPGLSYWNGNIYVAWSGKDSGHHISTGQYLGAGQTVLAHHTVTSLQSLDDVGMAGAGGRSYLGFHSLDGFCKWASSSNGTSFSSSANCVTQSPPNDNTNEGVDVAYDGSNVWVSWAEATSQIVETFTVA